MISKISAIELLKRKAKRLLQIKKGIFGNKCGFKLWTRKRSKTAIKRSLQLNDIAIKKKHLEWAEIRRRMQKLAEEDRKVTRRIDKLSAANKKARDALKKLDNLKCHISIKIQRCKRLTTQAVGTLPNIHPQLLDCVSTTDPATKGTSPNQLSVSKSSGDPTASRQDYLFQLFKTAFEKYQPEEEASDDEFWIPGINASQDNRNDPENRVSSNPNVNPLSVAVQDKRSDNKVVENKPAAAKLVEVSDNIKKVKALSGKLCKFYTMLFLKPKTYWGKKCDIFKRIYDLTRKTAPLATADKVVSMKFMLARKSPDNDLETIILYCALSELMIRSESEKSFAMKIIFIISKSQGLPNVLKKTENSFVRELDNCVDTFIKISLEKYLNYHKNRHVNSSFKENPKFEWRSSLPNIQVPAEYPSFKECGLVKEGKKRHTKYMSQSLKSSLYSVYYEFLSTTTIESKVLDLDFCFIETAIAANPDTDPMEFEKFLFEGIFDSYETLDPSFKISQ